MWDFNALSETNILSFDFIKACSEYNFIWRYIFDNKMIDEKELFIRDCYRTHFMKPGSIFENIVKKVFKPPKIDFNNNDDECHKECELFINKLDFDD